MATKIEKGPLLLFPTHYLGNFILGLPWLCEVASQYPDTTIVIDSAFEPLLDQTKARSARIVTYPRALLGKSHGLFSRLRNYIRFLIQLRLYKHSCLLDLEGERFTGVIALLSGCPVRFGPTQKNAEWFYTETLTLDYENHRFNAFGELIRAWRPIDTPNSVVSYLEQEQYRQSVMTLVNPNEAIGSVVVIHPGASALFKRWPTSNFVQLNKLLVQEGYLVVWVGAGEADSTAISEITSQCDQDEFINLCNQLSFGELIALLKLSSIYVGADSGPMHLAASTGLPVLGLFGPSKESIWKPLGENSKVLRSEQPCHPECKGKICLSSDHCLKSLSAKFVLESVLNIAPISKSSRGEP